MALPLSRGPLIEAEFTRRRSAPGTREGSGSGGRLPRWGRTLARTGASWLLGLALLSPVWTSPADAAEQMSEIRLQMDRGQALYLQGKYEEAANVFETSYAAYPYSAFLFNAGVSYQKAGANEKALTSYRAYLEKDPKAPDAPQVRERILALEKLLAPVTAETPKADPAPTAKAEVAMKSLVIVETDPAGAPLKIWRRADGSTSEFFQKSSDFSLVHQGASPAQLSLDEGHYHIEIEKFSQYNASRTDIDVRSGQVHVFKANLSQGEFLASLRVVSPLAGARIYLDEEPGKSVLWGTVPHGELIKPGPHRLRVEAPGFQDFTTNVEVAAGEQTEILAELKPVEYGIVRLDSNAQEVWVSVDGKPAGTYTRGQDALNLSLPSGTHEILVSGDGLKDLRTTVQVAGGKVLPMRARMMKTYPRGAAIAQGVVAVGLIGASTYFAIESNRLHDEVLADQAAGALSPTDPRLTQGFWYSAGADAGFALGGIFGILSIYNFVRDPYPESQLQRGTERGFDGSEPKAPTFGALPRFGGAF